MITGSFNFARCNILTLFLFLTLTCLVNGQDSITVIGDTLIQKDLSDVIRSALHKPPKEKPASAGSLLLLPIIGSNPATGFMLGVGGQYAFKVPGSTPAIHFLPVIMPIIPTMASKRTITILQP